MDGESHAVNRHQVIDDLDVLPNFPPVLMAPPRLRKLLDTSGHFGTGI
jgi:hypothetical protein